MKRGNSNPVLMGPRYVVVVVVVVVVTAAVATDVTSHPSIAKVYCFDYKSACSSKILNNP